MCPTHNLNEHKCQSAPVDPPSPPPPLSICTSQFCSSTSFSFVHITHTHLVICLIGSQFSGAKLCGANRKKQEWICEAFSKRLDTLRAHIARSPHGNWVSESTSRSRQCCREHAIRLSAYAIAYYVHEYTRVCADSRAEYMGFVDGWKGKGTERVAYFSDVTSAAWLKCTGSAARSQREWSD